MHGPLPNGSAGFARACIITRTHLLSRVTGLEGTIHPDMGDFKLAKKGRRSGGVLIASRVVRFWVGETEFGFLPHVRTSTGRTPEEAGVNREFFLCFMV